MQQFKAATQNELAKLLSKKKYIVFLVIEVLICAIVLLVQLVIKQKLAAQISFNLVNMSMTMLTFFISIYIPLIVFMAACDLFSSEVHDGSLRAVLLRPVSRFKIFLGKTTAVFIIAVGYLVSLFIVTCLMQVFFGGGAQGFFSSLSAYLLDIFPLTNLVLMAALINQLTKSSTLAMLLSILVYIVLIIAGTFVSQLSGMLFTSYAQWHNLWIGATIPIGAMSAKIGLLVGYGTIFLTGGYYIFERRDV